MTELVKNALNYYDKNREETNPIFNKFKKYIFKAKNTNDLERNIIEFYDDDNKVYKYYYEIIGLYNQENEFWVWAWSLSDFSKNLTYTSRRLLNYGLDIDNNGIDEKYLKAELLTSRFRINTSIQLDIHIAIASYLTKYQKSLKLKIKEKKIHIYIYFYLITISK